MSGRVASSEARLLAVARGLVDGTPNEQLAALFAASHEMPARIGPTADALLRRTLALGAARSLARGGGWRRERRPGPDGALREGRLWERHGRPEIRFTTASARLLVALAGTPIAAGPVRRPPSRGAGDALLAFLAADALVASGFGDSLGALASEPLVQLALPWWAPPTPVDWVSWIPAHAWMIEGLRDRLAAAWLLAEREKQAARRVDRVVEGSGRQREVLDGFLGALEALDRRDLADFLLDAAERCVPDPAAPPALGARGLDRAQPLRARAEARAASASLLDAVLRLERGIHADRTVPFFEEAFPAAQARLARWEAFGEARAAVVRVAAARLHAPETAAG